MKVDCDTERAYVVSYIPPCKNISYDNYKLLLEIKREHIAGILKRAKVCMTLTLPADRQRKLDKHRPLVSLSVIRAITKYKQEGSESMDNLVRDDL